MAKQTKARPTSKQVIEVEATPVHDVDQPISNAVAQPNDNFSIIPGVSTADLEQALKTQTKQRGIIAEFVRSHLVDGTDFGRIHVMKECANKYSCKIDYHYSKAMLYKPGQEKLFSLFQISDKISKDVETLEMFNNPEGLIAYKCELFNKDGTRIGEGRGSAFLGNLGRDANSTIKIAEKRARMDACLSLGFSEYFSQDLDDPEYKSQAEQANRAQAAKAEAMDKDEFGLLPRDATEAIDNSERQVLNKMIIANGFSEQEEILELLRANGIEPTAITSGQARAMMQKLKSAKFALPEVKNPDSVVADDDAVDLYKDLAVAEAEAAKPPAPADDQELVIDDDLKEHVIDMYNNLKLNQRGDLWLKKIMTGKPWAKWETFTDAHWSKAYSVLMDILDDRVAVPAEYIEDSTKEPVVVLDEDAIDPETQQPIHFPDTAGGTS